MTGNFLQFTKLTKFFKIGNREVEILTVKVGAFLFGKMVLWDHTITLVSGVSEVSEQSEHSE